MQSVQRAADVLRALATAQPPDGLTAIDVAARTGLDRTVVHRLLRTLAAEELVAAGSGRYALGPAAFVLGQSFSDRHLVRRVVLPYAIDLHARIIGDRPWIISISIPLLDRVVILERIWGRSTPLSLLLDVGTQFPIDRTASGRALLAAFADGEGKRILGGTRWRAVAPAVDEIRRHHGLSIAHGELRPGMSAIALPIGRTPSASAALVLAGVDLAGHARPDSNVVRELRDATGAAASALSLVTSESIAGEGG